MVVLVLLVILGGRSIGSECLEQILGMKCTLSLLKWNDIGLPLKAGGCTARFQTRNVANSPVAQPPSLEGSLLLLSGISKHITKSPLSRFYQHEFANMDCAFGLRYICSKPAANTYYSLFSAPAHTSCCNLLQRMARTSWPLCL